MKTLQKSKIKKDYPLLTEEEIDILLEQSKIELIRIAKQHLHEDKFFQLLNQIEQEIYNVNLEAGEQCVFWYGIPDKTDYEYSGG